MLVMTVENKTTGTSYRIEQLWYIEHEAQAGTRQLWIRGETEDEAIEHAVLYGVPREQIRRVNKWGFNLDCPGVVLSLWRSHLIEEESEND